MKTKNKKCENCGKLVDKLTYHSMYSEEDTDDDGCFVMMCDNCIHRFEELYDEEQTQ